MAFPVQVGLSWFLGDQYSRGMADFAIVPEDERDDEGGEQQQEEIPHVARAGTIVMACPVRGSQLTRGYAQP
jgi:hypothetical protein